MRKVRGGPASAAVAPAAAPAPAFSLSDTIELSPTGLSLMPSDTAGAPAAAAPTDPEVERWRVHDLSSKGYGLLIGREAADAVLLNGLLALQQPRNRRVDRGQRGAQARQAARAARC